MWFVSMMSKDVAFFPLLDSYSIYIPGDHHWCSFPWTHISISDRIESSSARLLCTL